MLNNHCGINRGSANKLTNLQEQSKPSNNQINVIQSAAMNNSNNHDNISSENSEIQSLNNTLSATMDEKQKMLLLKIANNSIAAASAVAADNDYGNVSAFFNPLFSFIRLAGTFFGVSCHISSTPATQTLERYRVADLIFRFVYHSMHTPQPELGQFQLVESTDIHTETRLFRDVQRICYITHAASHTRTAE
jgi:hypothetical protein